MRSVMFYKIYKKKQTFASNENTERISGLILAASCFFIDYIMSINCELSNYHISPLFKNVSKNTEFKNLLAHCRPE